MGFGDVGPGVLLGSRTRDAQSSYRAVARVRRRSLGVAISLAAGLLVGCDDRRRSGSDQRFSAEFVHPAAAGAEYASTRRRWHWAESATARVDRSISNRADSVAVAHALPGGRIEDAPE